jgi:hypothetical protein
MPVRRRSAKRQVVIVVVPASSLKGLDRVKRAKHSAKRKSVRRVKRGSMQRGGSCCPSGSCGGSGMY